MELQTLEPNTPSLLSAVQAEASGNGTVILTRPPGSRTLEGEVLASIVFDKTEGALPLGTVTPEPNAARLYRVSGGSSLDELDYTHTVYLFGMALQAITDHYSDRIDSIVFTVPKGVDPSAAAQGLRLNLLRADHTATKRKKNPSQIHLCNLTGKDQNEFDAAVAVGDLDACCANVARFLTALPVNYLDVEGYADLIRAFFEGMEGVTVFEPEPEEYAKMGLFTAVAQATGLGPRLLCVQVDPVAPEAVGKKPDVEIGKGIVDDTGGLCTKKDGGGPQMRCDMGGSAVVFARALSVAKNRRLLKRPWMGVLAIARNAIGPDAYRVGDVLSSFTGKRVEILNTDAEGRLVLADAIEYVDAESITVIATLTGAAKVGIGAWASALHIRGKSGPCEAFDEAERLSQGVGDPVHRLYEMGAFSAKAMKSTRADIANCDVADKAGGSQTAFHFLSFFAPEGVPFRFIDIAGKVDVDTRGGLGIRKDTVRPAAVFFLNEEMRRTF